MKLFLKIIIISFIICQNAIAQGGATSCAALQADLAAYQSCATNVPFANQTANNSESIRPRCFGEDVKAPTWFFMQIKSSGDINLRIEQISNLANAIDVDFAIWGPFATLNNICPQLTDTNLLDCSFSPEPIEDVTIPNAITGQYYILLVDNYAQLPGQITISTNGGTGSSDCGFLSPVSINDTSNAEITQNNYCKPETKDLKAIVDVSDFTANPANLRFNYRWTKDGVVVATTNNSTAPNNIFNASTTGLYKIEIAAYDSSDPLVNINNIPFPPRQTDEIALVFYEKPTLSSTTSTLQECDLVAPNNNGFTTVNLTQAYNSITNNTAGISLRYYLDAALTQLILQPNAFTNTVSASQTIYVVGDFGQPFYCPSNPALLQLTVTPTSLSAYPNMAPVCPQLNQNFGLLDFETQRQNVKNLYFPSANVTIQFYASAADASLEQNQLINTSQIPIGITTVYTKIKSGINCSNVGTFLVEVKIAPNQNAISNVLLCRTDNFTLVTKDAELLQSQIGNNIVSYHLNQNDAVNNVAAVSKTTTFTGNLGVNNIVARIVNTTTQCYVTVPFTITIYPNPNFNTTPKPYRVCSTTTTGTFDLTTQTINLIGTNSYALTFYETQLDYNNNNAIANPQNYVSLSKNVFVKAVDASNNNCASQTILALQVEIKPGSITNPTPFLKCNTTGFDTFNLTTKEGEMAGPNVVTDLVFRYYLTSVDAENNATNAINNPTNFQNNLKNYQRIFVRISNVDATQICNSILNIDLYISEFPIVKLDTNPYNICQDANGVIIEEAKIDTKLTADKYSFVWYNGIGAVAGNAIVGQTAPTFSTPIVGLYSVKVTNFSTPANCETIANFSTRILITPTTLSVLPDEIIAFSEPNLVTISALPQSTEYEYQLNDGTWQNSNAIENLKPGANIIRVRNKFGCASIETIVVSADFRRFFTPNGDGYNDFWKIDGDSALDISSTYIYDRFGQLLYQHQKSSDGWDGTFDGKPLPADDYWFRIVYRNNNIKSEMKGHFTLKR